MEKVAKIIATNNLEESINLVVSELGGFKEFIKKGDIIFIKPNCNTADPLPASSDVEFIEALTSMLYKNGAKLVAVGDSSTVTLNTKKVLEQKGFYKLLEMETPPRIYIFEEGKWVALPIPNGIYVKKVSVPEILTKADKVIFVPCLKTHKQAQYTGALKLAVGFVKSFERIPMHLKNLQEKVAEINSVIKCDLVIMDARRCFITGGPNNGEVREPNLILVSRGRTAVDIEGIKIIQSFKGNSLSNLKTPEDLLQIKRALELGIR
jgi:uncharacterized protein (DUF362 family)